MLSSKLVMLIVSQIIIFLSIGLFGLIIYVIVLRKKLTASENKPSNNLNNTDLDEQQLDSKANDSWQYSEFLNEELVSMVSIYQALSGTDKLPEIDPEQEEKLSAIAIRYRIFKAEKQAVEFYATPEPFWASLNGPLLTIASSLPAIPALLNEATNNQPNTEFESLNIQIKDLENAQKLLFILQSQARSLLPKQATKELLPLANEIEILQSDGGLEELSNAYSMCFKSLSPTSKIDPVSKPNLDKDEPLIDRTLTNDQNNVSEDKHHDLHEQIKDLKKSQEFLFALQGQTRTLLPTYANKELLPLTNEIELLKSEGGLESLTKAYAKCFERLSSTEKVERKSQQAPHLEKELQTEAELIKDQKMLIERFTKESKEMLQAIDYLEKENEELKVK